MIVIYHGPGCADGFTAAWVAWCKYGSTDVKYVGASHGDAPPDVTGEDVLIVDFSYPRAVIEQMATKAKSLRIFDHHKTAQADLAGLEYAVFDMNRSGAGITWDELNPFQARPDLVNYVQDRDLWRWQLISSRAVSAVIAETVKTFEAWDVLRRTIADEIGEVVQMGELLLRAVDRYVETMVVNARIACVAQHWVPVVNAPPIHASELVGKLAELTPSAPFAVGWYQAGNGAYRYALRSRGDFDVSAIAKQFGGGGHASAAWFEWPERADI